MKQQFIDALVRKLPPLDDFVSVMARNDIDVVTKRDKAMPAVASPRGRIIVEIDDSGRVIRSSQLQPPPRTSR